MACPSCGSVTTPTQADLCFTRPLFAEEHACTVTVTVTTIPSSSLHRRSAAPFSWLVVASLLVSSCSDSKDATSVHIGRPASLTIVSGDAQSGVVGQELPQPVVVKVVDANGNAVSGQAVNFRVTDGGGSVFAGASVTNADGIAQERWTLGTVAGAQQTLEARAVDNATGQALVFATFHATATADAAAALLVRRQPSTAAQSGNRSRGLADHVHRIDLTRSGEQDRNRVREQFHGHCRESRAAARREGAGQLRQHRT